MKYLILILIIFQSRLTLKAQTNVGIVNTQRILDTMPSSKKKLSEQESWICGGFKELRIMDSLFQVYINHLNCAGFNKVQGEIEEKKINDMQNALQLRQEDLEMERLALEDSLYKPILNRIKLAIKIVAERNNLSCILDNQEVLYFKDAIDYRNEVIEEVMKLESLIETESNK